MMFVRQYDLVNIVVDINGSLTRLRKTFLLRDPVNILNYSM